MFTKSNNQKTFTTTQFHTFNDKKHMKQNLCASTFEIIKATFWPQFWRFGKAIDVYVEVISCWRWSFNKRWFESFHFVFNSSQVHQCTQYERVLKSFAFAIFHQTPWANIKIKFHLHWKHIQMYALVQTTWSLQLHSNFHTKWQLVLINIVSNSTSHKLDPYQMPPIANS